MVFDPAPIRKNLGAFSIATLIVIVALSVRVNLMRSVETRLDADESIVGLMSKHIAVGKPIPLFFYGQHYGGGHVIEALGASAWWPILHRPSSFAVQSIPVLCSVLLIFLVFYYMRMKFNLFSASLASLILAFSIPFVKSSLKADGYIETILFCFFSLILYELSEKAYAEKAAKRLLSLVFFCGLCLGIGIWSYDFAILYVPIIILLAAPRVLRSLPRIILFIFGLAAGASPAIYDNIKYNFAHLEHLSSGGPSGASSSNSIAINVITFFKDFLPAFFSPDCVHNFSLPAHPYSWLIYSSVIISTFVLLFHFRKTPITLFLAPAIVFLALSISGYSGKSPRYLLPLEPFLSMILAAAINTLVSHKKLAFNLIAATICALFLSGTIIGYSFLSTDNSIMEGNVKTDPASLPAVAAFLKKLNIDCVYTSYFIKWQLLYMSDENINAVDIQAHERKYSYDEYEKKGCSSPDLPVFVFHKYSPYLRTVNKIYQDRNLNYKIYSHFTDHVVLIPFVDTNNN